MIRRQKSDNETVSLFPFLSIIVCVIGILTMLITVMAVIQAAEPPPKARQRDPEALSRAERYRRLRESISRTSQELDKLREEVEKAREKLAALEKQLGRQRLVAEERNQRRKEAAEARNRRQSEVAEAARLQAEIQRLIARIESREADLDRFRREAEPLKAELAARRKTPDEPVVRIRPSGSGKNLKPVFVECAQSGAILLEEPGQPRLRIADLESSEAFLKTLERVKRDPQATVIFLLRPDGVNSFVAARGAAERQFVRHGKLPVTGQGKIDLSMFRK